MEQIKQENFNLITKDHNGLDEISKFIDSFKTDAVREKYAIVKNEFISKNCRNCDEYVWCSLNKFKGRMSVTRHSNRTDGGSVCKYYLTCRLSHVLRKELFEISITMDMAHDQK